MRVRGIMLALAVAALPTGVAAQAVEASDDNDRAVHAFLSAVDLGEVQQGMLATERATNAEVRSFAQRMIGEHSNALHTREMLMQTENSGLVVRMAGGTGTQVGPAHSHPDAQGVAGQDTVVGAGAQAHGERPEGPPSMQAHSHPDARGVAGQDTAGVVTVRDGAVVPAGQAAAHAGHGNMPAGAHAGHGNMPAGAHAGHAGMHGALPHGVTPEMVQQLHATLEAHPMSAPVMAANARNMQVLQGVTGPQFDASYLDAQIGAHRYALQNIDRMLGQTEALGDDITASLRTMRTTVADHLQTAELLRGRLP